MVVDIVCNSIGTCTDCFIFLVQPARLYNSGDILVTSTDSIITKIGQAACFAPDFNGKEYLKSKGEVKNREREEKVQLHLLDSNLLSGLGHYTLC